MKDYLSYIIPSYNAASFLDETVASIFKQNLKIPFEVIISDDMSTDGTQNLIIKLAHKHPEIRYFLNKENKYAPANRNFAITQSRGNLIYMSDHDNILEDNSIQKLIDAINQTGCGAASVEELYFFKGDISDHRGSWIYKYPDNLFTIKEFITYSNTPAGSNNYMYTRAAYNKAGGYPENLGTIGDNMGFAFRLLVNGIHIAIVPKTRYYHRVVPSSMFLVEQNKSPERRHSDVTSIFREFIDVFDKKTQKLLLSEKASREANFYIAKGKLKLSDKGWALCGSKKRYGFKVLIIQSLMPAIFYWQLAISKFSLLKYKIKLFIKYLCRIICQKK